MFFCSFRSAIVHFFWGKRYALLEHKRLPQREDYKPHHSELSKDRISERERGKVSKQEEFQPLYVDHEANDVNTFPEHILTKYISRQKVERSNICCLLLYNIYFCFLFGLS